MPIFLLNSLWSDSCPPNVCRLLSQRDDAGVKAASSCEILGYATTELVEGKRNIGYEKKIQVRLRAIQRSFVFALEQSAFHTSSNSIAYVKDYHILTLIKKHHVVEDHLMETESVNTATLAKAGPGHCSVYLAKSGSLLPTRLGNGTSPKLPRI